MSYIHYSPYIAQFILSKIIHEVNRMGGNLNFAFVVQLAN